MEYTNFSRRWTSATSLETEAVAVAVPICEYVSALLVLWLSAGIEGRASGHLQSPITDNKRKRYKTRKIASLPPTFLHIGLMLSTVRTPFKEISGNRPNGKHLSPYWRGVIAEE